MSEPLTAPPPPPARPPASVRPEDLGDSQEVVVVGAGPAGLALACALADAGIGVTLLERQPWAALADAAPDGRDIALTHRGRRVLETLGIWDGIPAGEVAPLNAAEVRNAASPTRLWFHEDASAEAAARAGRPLGWLVPNHLIRRAALAAAARRPGVRIACDCPPLRVERATATAPALVRLGQGETARTLRAGLLVAADSRYSETRRQLGIGAWSHDFARSALVARMRHPRDHGGVALEWFQHGGTLALLPMNRHEVSLVLTLPGPDIAALAALPPEAFDAWVRHRCGDALGGLRLCGERFTYPLVAVYAHRFTGPGCVLIGDAAVGMHPVTAHGYNFGLYGVESLVRRLAAGRAAGRPLADPALLSAWEAEHRRATAPVFAGTQAVVGLFTDDRAPARWLREAVLGTVSALPPVRRVVTGLLTGRRGTAFELPTPQRAAAALRQRLRGTR
jgi:ubiquinone biosynthesis UbiH/UbiF/VisC/COQ6 family hydroxylase